MKKISTADRDDIRQLEENIHAFKTGKMHEERFRHYRLTRGVYGQRQEGVQMFRTKLPFGKIKTHQLEVLANLAEKYGHNNLHITTRQNVQLHYVKLDDSPQIWKGLAAAGLTARGACGNTVRNITASPTAGVDIDEPFDISPYVQTTFEYFLRNAICQDMGRKIKMSFSATEADSGYTYFHDFGMVAKLKEVDGQTIKGFKIVAGGGLGAQSISAPVLYDFIPAEDILPYIDAGIRVFDRYGERQKRQKARMKFLIKKIGIDEFRDRLEREKDAIPLTQISPSTQNVDLPANPKKSEDPISEEFELWKKSNVISQKQSGYLGVFINVHLGDISSDRARKLAKLIRETAADDLRFTPDQNIFIRFVHPESLGYLYRGLEKLSLADPGYGSLADITACPGTDTCALGVSNSTGLAGNLKSIVHTNYKSLLDVKDIQIKISGCMNSCGQHMAATIGFHGSSIKKDHKIIPAMQVVLGGGVDQKTGKGFLAERIIKLPTKRIPQALHLLLHNYQSNKNNIDTFLEYYWRINDRKYFYSLLKPLANLEDITETDYFDWNQNQAYIQSIGVGECAGVSYDMVGAILGDAIEKLAEAKKALILSEFTQSIYHSYTGMIIAAKAHLLSQDITCNTHIGIIEDFEKLYAEYPMFPMQERFGELLFKMRDRVPNHLFSRDYLGSATDFVENIVSYRASLVDSSSDKLVVDNYYKA